jgi:hypothetical protein
MNEEAGQAFYSRAVFEASMMVTPAKWKAHCLSFT